MEVFKKIIFLFLLFILLIFLSCKNNFILITQDIKIVNPENGDIIRNNNLQIIIESSIFPFIKKPSKVSIYFAGYSDLKEEILLQQAPVNVFLININSSITDGPHVIFFEFYDQNNKLILRKYINVVLDRL
ncbi:MAG: hypothetical protein N3A58_08375 [Spirochaetes bacterium]|nr:hypothetical protein [Spirochaetota bacterium]